MSNGVSGPEPSPLGPPPPQLGTSEPPGGGDRFLLDVVKRSKTPRILVLNKVDLVDKPALLPRLEDLRAKGAAHLQALDRA